MGPLRPGDSLRRTLGVPVVIVGSVLPNELMFSFSLPINSQLESTAHEPSCPRFGGPTRGVSTGLPVFKGSLLELLNNGILSTDDENAWLVE